MYRYRVTVEALSEGDTGTLEFEVENHDDVVAIASRVSGRYGLDTDATKALIVGYKLLGEIVLKKRAEEPFAALRPALREFGQSLKKGASVE